MDARVKPAHDELVTTSVDIALFGALAGPIPEFSCFFCRFGIFHPRSHDLKHTHTSSFPRRMSAPGVCIVASPTPNRGVGGAPRDVRVQRHPLGVPSCAKDARKRAYDAARQAPSEAPCVP